MIDKITNLANYVENKLLVKLSNEIYHDCKDELDEFNVLAYQYMKPAIEESKKKYIDDMTRHLKIQAKNEKLNKIANQLAEWRNERKLTTESQQKNLIGNVLEELTELARAQTDEERIDSYCDICVFAINSYDKTLNCDCWIPLRNANDELENFCEIIVNQIGYKQIDRVVGLCFYNMKLLGYDPYLCMEQTIQEISSRKQDPQQKEDWDKNGVTEKWQKWKEQPLETLYKANYNLCKIEKE